MFVEKNPAKSHILLFEIPRWIYRQLPAAAEMKNPDCSFLYKNSLKGYNISARGIAPGNTARPPHPPLIEKPSLIHNQ